MCGAKRATWASDHLDSNSIPVEASGHPSKVSTASPDPSYKEKRINLCFHLPHSGVSGK